MEEVFLLRDIVGKVVEGRRGVDVDEELPVALADGGSPHRHAPVEGLVGSFFNIATEEGEEVAAIVIDDLLLPFFGDAGRKLFSGGGDESGKKIERGEGMSEGGAGRESGGPMEDEGDADPAFEE